MYVSKICLLIPHKLHLWCIKKLQNLWSFERYPLICLSMHWRTSSSIWFYRVKQPRSHAIREYVSSFAPFCLKINVFFQKFKTFYILYLYYFYFLFLIYVWKCKLPIFVKMYFAQRMTQIICAQMALKCV